MYRVYNRRFFIVCAQHLGDAHHRMALQAEREGTHGLRVYVGIRLLRKIHECLQKPEHRLGEMKMTLCLKTFVLVAQRRAHAVVIVSILIIS